MCRSDPPVGRPFPIIGTRFVIVPAERHIGRSLRARYYKFQLNYHEKQLISYNDKKGVFP